MLHVNLVTPDKILLNEDCIGIVIPTLNGEVQILPGHANFLSQVTPGVVIVSCQNGEQKKLMVGEGFLEVLQNKVEVICDVARLKSEINFEQERKNRDSLTGDLEKFDKDSLEFKRISSNLQKSLASLKLED